MRHFPIACTLLLAASSLPLDAQTLVRSANGPAGSQYYKDLLVGAPAYNAGRGAVFCLSGAYLANGTGAQNLWSVTPTLNAGDQFGFALANVGDVTSDGIVDFLVGEPGYASGTGAVRLINGSSHTASAELSSTSAGARFGTSIAAISDVTGDGRREVAVGEPVVSQMRILKGSGLTLTGPLSNSSLYASVYSGGEYATSLASGFDFDGDGYDELVIGCPGSDNAGAVDAGTIVITSVTPSNFQGIASFQSAVPGERFGQSVAIGHDFDGDGAPDIVVGAPNTPDTLGGQVGRAVVLSGGKLANHAPPYEIYTYGTPGSSGLGFNYHFGAAVCACADLNGDGVDDFLIGTPDYFVFPGFNHKGAVAVYSGATGTLLCSITGGSNEQLGEGLVGAVGDFDGDGFKEFVVAGALADNAGTDSGVVKCYRLFPLAPSTYCTGKVNSLGCTPSISYSGSPSASSTAPFNITASNFVNQKNGLLFYSAAPAAVLFQGGTKCAANPILRTPPQNSGGSASGSSCTGAYSFDFNHWIANGWDFSLGAGSEIYAQYWSRDPASPSHTGLSNAIRFVINP
jgi:hypothetical protein